jgi:hypothetical protein
MAQVIKKATVPRNLLSEIDWETEGYLLRYRLVAENRNLRSHWSPTYFVPVEDFAIVDGQIVETISDTDPTQSNITVTWDDLFNRPQYDVFVSFRGNDPETTFEYDGEQFHYHGTTSVHSYSFLQREGVTSIRVIVQPAANKKLIKPNFIIYDGESVEQS